MRYWHNPEDDDYGVSTNEIEASGFIALGYQEIDRIEFDQAMRALK